LQKTKLRKIFFWKVQIPFSSPNNTGQDFAACYLRVPPVTVNRTRIAEYPRILLKNLNPKGKIKGENTKTGISMCLLLFLQ